MKRNFLLKILIANLLFQTIFIPSALAQIQDERAVGNKSAGEKRIALVLGNSDYDASIGKLKNPVNDANDMAEALKRLGFSLVGGKPQLNLNRRQMLEQIREFGSQIKQGGVGLFYFAGHGVQVDRRNYLIPITESLKYQEDAEFEAVDVDAVLREMEYAENALNILILDACRNNALPKKTRNLKDGLIEPNRKPSGVYIAFAARDGQTASENVSGRNGLYTQELLKNLETPNLRLEDIFIRTRVKVKELSKRTQEPIEYGSLDSTFYFKLSEKTAIQPLPNSAQVAWNSFRGIAKNLLKYDEIELFSEDLMLVKLNEKYGLINRSGKEVAPIKYSSINSETYDMNGIALEDMFRVSIENKLGFIDKSGQEIIPIKYDYLGSFSEGLVPAQLSGKWGFLDKTGRIIVTFKFEDVYSFNYESDYIGLDSSKTTFNEGIAPVKLNGKWGFINKLGKTIIPFKLNYDYVFPFENGFAQVMVKSTEDESFRFGIIDKNGKEIIPVKFEQISFFSDGVAMARADCELFIIDKTGKIIKKFGHGGGRFVEGGLERVYENNPSNESFIDKKGNVILSAQNFKGKYRVIGHYREGLAQVSSYDFNESSGYIDKSGNLVIPFNKYTEIGLFDLFKVQGFAEVWVGKRPPLGGKQGLIDKTFKEIIPPIYDRVVPLSNNIFEVRLNEKIGLANDKGKELTPQKYDGIWAYAFVNQGFIGVTLNGKKGFVDIYGNEYFDF